MKTNNYPEYKGYHARIEFDSEGLILHGRIDGINDLVTFESDTSQGIIIEFHAAVDDYLSFCEDVGKEPNKEYKGTFNVRITPELHKEISEWAGANNKSLNSCVEEAIKWYLNKEVFSSYSEFHMTSDSTYSPKESYSGKFNVTDLTEVC